MELLRDAHAQIRKTSVEERFSRAATTEEQAVVGRAGRIEYVSSDTGKRLADVIDAGTELVKTDVDPYNAALPIPLQLKAEWKQTPLWTPAQNFPVWRAPTRKSGGRSIPIDMPLQRAVWNVELNQK